MRGNGIRAWFVRPGNAKFLHGVGDRRRKADSEKNTCDCPDSPHGEPH